MKIMVVDDSATMRRLIAKSLNKIGYSDKQMAMCSSCKYALELLNLNSYVYFDLILLDYHMPEMNGLQFLKILKQGPHKDIPVIMLTMEQQKERIVQAIKNGASEYIVKPLDTKILKEKIDTVQSQKNENT